jgi:hypothetical protein
MACPNELPPRRRPWAFDNGAFGAWKAGRPFDADAFLRALDRIAADNLHPDFIVAPDIVAGGLRSLEYSLSWAAQVAAVAPAYLAVQDGMEYARIAPYAEMFAGIFVGGTLSWKIETGRQWVELAHRLGPGLPCHIGRVGTYDRVRWAVWAGADSIDSCLPLWSEENLTRFRQALYDTAPQMRLSTDDGWGRRVAAGMGA